MAKEQPWKDYGMNKAEWLAAEVAKAVNAGYQWNCETVDFNDPNRPLTCLEVDFPIIPINQIAAIEGNAGKPIYQMSKWWARRRSSVFRSMLLAAAMKAPDDPAEASKKVWDVYYGNHQAKGAFKHLKVADIFMGGGTTIVEGSRLGMQMYGNDLNPVAWFVTKNELAQVDKGEVEKLLAEIEAEVKPQIMPFYTCDCPRGHKGKWTKVSTGEVMGDDFDATVLSPEQRKDYSYEGPEIIYVFWAKHGPCPTTGCDHRTPIMSSPVMAVKEISIKVWQRECGHCGKNYDLEEQEARMAPGVPLVVADTEKPYAIAKIDKWGKIASAVCPHCGKENIIDRMPASIGRPGKKKVSLSLLVHPDWLKGESATDADGNPYGGSADDDVESTIRWNIARAKTCKLIEVRGDLPEEIICPDTGVTIKTGKDGGTVPDKSKFACATCGTTSDIREAIAQTGKNGPIAMYAVQGYCPHCDKEGQPYGGRFFIPVTNTAKYDAALAEWDIRKNSDLDGYWPTSEVPFGFMTGMANGDIRKAHGFTHWWKMFNPRQLIVHSALLKKLKKYEQDEVAEFVLGAFQQYLRNQCMFTIWNAGADKLEPMFANNNYHPKSTMVENCVFANLGRGNWKSQYSNMGNTLDWSTNPWETIQNGKLSAVSPHLADYLSGKSEKTFCGDPLCGSELLACMSASERLTCGSSTELQTIEAESYDAVITDPPFGGLLHYSELADFFYVWMRLVLKDKYPEYFASEYTPKTLEVVANKARHDDPDAFYQRLLTECWKEAHRILKPGGILSFTFHHSEDAPWVSVLESLFDAGFYLQATYPIRSDETKGTGQFGSKMIEYDIIHVCRKRINEPSKISWPKLRRQVLRDVRELQELLEHHGEEGLPEADMQVIRRGKALEYFSRHYGQVYKDEDTPITVLEALVGINQLLDEETEQNSTPPPHKAEPFTRMLLRLFENKLELPRDQMQKFLRGSGSAPSDFISRGWVTEKNKIFTLVSPLEIAQGWIGQKRKTMTSDYEQAMFFIGACIEGSGINASETLNNPNFKPHPALKDLLVWFKTRGGDAATRDGAILAARLYAGWESKNQATLQKQATLFDLDEEND
jgi:putative DNA methylase